MYYEVIPTKLFRTGKTAGTLTYSSDEPLKPGQIIEVPLGKSKTVAIIVKKVSQPDFPTKPILRKLYDEPLPSHLLKSIFWLSDYYLCPLPTVASLFLPIGVSKKRTKKSDFRSKSNFPNQNIQLNSAQQRAIKALANVTTATKLLHGITGSGKTNIYLELTKNTLEAQKSVILLVPEIALTSQLVQIFKNTFAGQKITLIHSKQTEAERHLIWEDILKDANPQIVIGPRSALTVPLKNLGLIIIDEAHESAYFQENAPKYSTLKLASFIATTLKISCIQGTATPLATDYYLAKSHASVVKLTEKAKNSAKNPDIHVIDLKNRQNFTKNRYFSDQLLKSIKNNLENGHQTLIFHNRRGSAPLTICENCGWQALCPTCFLPLTLHTDAYELVCHACGHTERVPKNCPSCGHPEIIHKGFGTKLLENELGRLFKTAKIARFDADNTKSNSLDALYDDVKSGKIDILIGTQTLAKGLDLPNLTTIGVVQADAGLNLPDFAAEERTFHLLTQVLGRIGRGHQDIAEAFIQTYQPDHPAIQAAIDQNYENFYSYLLKNRQKAKLPPFTYLAKLSLTYKTESTVLKYIKNYEKILAKNPKISISTPMPAFHERSLRGYTWQLIVKSTSRAELIKALKSLPENPNLRLTLDPPSLLQ